MKRSQSLAALFLAPAFAACVASGDDSPNAQPATTDNTTTNVPGASPPGSITPDAGKGNTAGDAGSGSNGGRGGPGPGGGAGPGGGGGAGGARGPSAPAAPRAPSPRAP